MRKQLSIYIFITILLLTSSFLHAHAEEKKRKDYYDDYERFVKVVKVILDKYVDEIEIKDLFHNAYKGMLSGLDSYSQFFGPGELEDLKIETEGEFEGLGIEVVIKKGALIVISPIVDSPAMRAGVLAGDIILRIDGKSTENLSFREVIGCLRGDPGSEVTLTVLHRDEVEPVDIIIKRAKIHVKSVKGARIVNEEMKIGYLAITNFQDHTLADLNKTITDLKKQEMKSLILDLRFNPGGLLNVAIDVSDLFLKNGIIVSTKGRSESQSIIYKAHKKGSLIDYPLIVLINNGSASASEIVAGAIKDNKRGILLGNKTFGKGSVQSLLPVDDGTSALKLTTARYYTPSGVSIHEKGIEPDIEVILSMDEIRKLHENLPLINNLLIKKDDIIKNNNEEGHTDKKFYDRQLEHAINILKSIEIISDLN